MLENLITLLTPFVVWGATWVVTKIFPTISGWGIVLLVVPVLGALVTWIGTLITPESLWYVNLLFSLLAVFINEVKVQLTKKPSSPKIEIN